MLSRIPIGRATLAVILLGCVGAACDGEGSPPAAVAPPPETAALATSCDVEGASPPPSCEMAGPSSADVNQPFEASASPSGRLVRFQVEAMTCEGCAWQIREALLGVPGVARAHTRVDVRDALVDYDPAIVDVTTIAAALEAAAYPAVVIDEDDAGNQTDAEGR